MNMGEFIMASLANKHGGGSKTNINGLHFEQTTSLNDALINKGYTIKNGYDVYKDINFGSIISKQLLPDDAFYNLNDNTIYILEKKFQNSHGSVDEKLQTCGFKKWEYEKLFSPINIKVEYIYILNDWFKQSKYHDTLDYINLQNCHYYFNEIPLDFLNL